MTIRWLTRARAESQSAIPAYASWYLREGDEICPGRHALRRLGGGVRFEAYLAWDDQLMALAVVKMLRPDLTDDVTALAALGDEARILERLDHPVIMRAFDAVLDGPRPHLLLEYIDAPHLSTLLRTSQMSLEQTLPLGIQLSSAVHYMGMRDVLHLDIKPRNIMMAGPPRLIDLSLALTTDELSRLTSPIGTPRYMAPEQCDPARLSRLSSAADMWAVGVTMYWTLAGRSPFSEPDSDEAAPLTRRYPQLAEDPAPLPDHVPGPLAELLAALLDPHPECRPSAAETIAELEPMAAALPSPRLSRFQVRRRARR